MTATNATSSLAVAPAALNITSSSDAGSVSASSSTEAQDRFLKLLVAQLSNQDPMNPMDNAQMTSQIAQINTVTGIQQLNDTMKSMASQMSAMQVLQAGNLVGHNVLAEGNKLTFAADGQTAVGAIELAGAAKNVQVQVTTPGGQVIDTVQLGPLAAGQHGFTLDAAAYPSDMQLQFKVTATDAKGDAVTTTSLMRDQVVAVGNGTDGTLSLTLLNAGATPYASVRAVL
ncbi:MAG: flagellar hook assembly protein FlgD [Gammaproteobacteria bacterium]|nr:flagellar hook assembly protein FlgD [Gammaproteobacteria bacterium]MBU1443359.1 flagellar hook assembly protein FlgD [Gammaproteobacteria bacterium]MBU2286154.1 flagellar hook assembly protein FlgD [Gammaproteobacteria bacterium]MBU2409416.1 flagellar hook assembly protein FlgD [Gammaproteobacteria bacterium]